MKLPWLDAGEPYFPNTRDALSEPNGLLAAGGQLSVDWLLAAYQRGIFPWFNEGDPILWWTPSPRMVLYPHQLHISRSLRKALKKTDFQVTINQAFTSVITACAQSRSEPSDTPRTWITSQMTAAYLALHHAGYAHSVEVWRKEQLIGGLYGIALGKIFFGESMFSQATNGSKIAIVHLVECLKRWHYKLIDCQVYNDHLSSLGAIEIDRHSFEQIISRYGAQYALTEQENCSWQAKEITLPSDYW
jgi:leucyl/phenylalanyl-tRNA--protein transferase